ncbi:MAG: DUF1990 domain-containing protein [Myxococcales bacterium]|nr:DUF1990 domain-containing protein [Myxococcales bacterium]
MLHVWRPGPERVRDFIAGQRDRAFSYEAVGCTKDERRPARFAVDHNRQLLGTGAAAFERAKQAVRGWRMFPPPWTAIEPDDAPIEIGTTVAVHVRVMGLWWLNATRIVYTIDEPRRFGFAYGTLPGHAELGEERFVVEWLADDTVWYDVLAYSRPCHLLPRLLYPLARRYQRRFGRESKAAMERSVRP